MKYGFDKNGKPRRESGSSALSEDEKKSKKARLSVDVLKVVAAMDEVETSLKDAAGKISSIEGNFEGQRELQMRCKMIQRVLKSALSLISGNKPKLWMIDDESIK